MAKISDLSVTNDKPQNLKGVIQFIMGTTTIVLPLAQSINLEAEKQRLQKEVQKVESDLESGIKRLANQDFMAKAKPEVVEELKERVINLQATIEKIKEALWRIV